MGRTIARYAAALALASGCLSTSPTEVSLGQEFELAPNQSVRVSGTNLTVGFRGVSPDTRCPIDVFCAVAGSAGIQLDVFGSDTDGQLVLEPTPPRNLWTDGQATLEVLSLTPVPSVARPIRPEDYRVRLVVR